LRFNLPDLIPHATADGVFSIDSLLQLRGQCIAGVSAHNDEWYPALLQRHCNFNSAPFTKTHVQESPIRWFLANQAHRAICSINRTNYSKPVVRNGVRKTLCGQIVVFDDQNSLTIQIKPPTFEDRQCAHKLTCASGSQVFAQERATQGCLVRYIRHPCTLAPAYVSY
jgi:hypothetical protein